MLEYIKSAVTRNQSEKKINSLLDFMAHSTNMKLLQVTTTSFIQSFYQRKTTRPPTNNDDTASPVKTISMLHQSNL